MKKALFVTDKDVNLRYSGVQVMTNRNYNSLVEVLGQDNVDVYQLEFLNYKNRFKKLINLLIGYNDFLNSKIIINLIKESVNYDFIVLDFSTWGIISKQLKNNGYKGEIISFFHNVEINYHWQEKKLKSFIGTLKLFGIYLNEKMTCKYSDKIIALNHRDAKKINKIYNRFPDAIIPISIKNRYTNIPNKNSIITKPYHLLFFGSYFWANVNGIKWFIKNVLPYLNDVELTVAGNGMSKIREEIDCSNFKLFDKVEDLTALIEESDFLVFPIFEGSGMKVKTAEALMYGKNIVGTYEAFVGYDIDYTKVGAVCNNQKEFIDYFNNINNQNIMKYNDYSRKIYESKYTYDKTLKQFENVLNK